jgi:hypothetical protein
MATSMKLIFGEFKRKELYFLLRRTHSTCGPPFEKYWSKLLMLASERRYYTFFLSRSTSGNKFTKWHGSWYESQAQIIMP